MPPNVQDRVIEVLKLHVPEAGRREAYCSCGDPVGDWAGDTEEHIAGALATAGLLALTSTEWGVRVPGDREVPYDNEEDARGVAESIADPWPLLRRKVTAWTEVTPVTGA